MFINEIFETQHILQYISNGSLSFDHIFQDIDKCIAVMTELENMSLTALLLRKNPDIMVTIKKVRINVWESPSFNITGDLTVQIQ